MYLFTKTILIAAMLAGQFEGNAQIFRVKHIQKNQFKKITPLVYDSTVIALIPFDKKMNIPGFDKNSRQAEITRQDIHTIDSLLKECIDHYNTSLKDYNNYPWWNIDSNYGNYKKQIVPVINAKGEKETWINCFCNMYGDTWKKEIIIADDGGKCFFNLKINLTKKKYYDFGINGSLFGPRQIKSLRPSLN